MGILLAINSDHLWNTDPRWGSVWTQTQIVMKTHKRVDRTNNLSGRSYQVNGGLVDFPLMSYMLNW